MLETQPQISQTSSSQTKSAMHVSPKSYIDPYKVNMGKYIDVFNNMSPYHFFVSYAEEMKKELTGSEGDFLKSFFDVVPMALDLNINNTMRIIEIDNNLIPMIENIGNEIYYRPLFFPTIFINNEFKFENMIVKGILVVDTRYIPDIKEQTCIIYTIAFDTDTYEFISSFTTLTSKDFYVSDIVPKNKIRQIERLNDHIREVVSNIIDFVERPYEIFERKVVSATREKNKERIEKGKPPLPEMIKINLNPQYNKYVNEYNKTNDECVKTHTKCAHLVRGHFRFLGSEWYKKGKRGTKIFILPHIRGIGDIVVRPYKMVGEMKIEVENLKEYEK